MGFRKFASSALDWGKDLPNKAINKGMGYVDSSAILDKVQDTTAYAQNRLLERSITNGENSASRLKSPLHRFGRGAQKLVGNTSAGDIDKIARNAIGSAATGAISGAVGGMVSEDQSVVGGALWGGALGGMAGGGLTAKRLYDKKTAGGKGLESASRLRGMRRSKSALSNVEDKMSWSETLKGNGSVSDTWKHNSKVNSQRKTRAADLGKVNSGIDAEYKKLNALNATRKGPVKDVNFWAVGGVAGAATLAHSTLTSNTALPY